ncbi:hypothetical protein ACIBBB_00085 [Streptomyces sp. NPDC051217]|uniref:hypothetical protein n=1 Tax=Streptomyces sp. NPDC051217 TaxID=3365644 RepID=UPI0037B432E1
MAVMSAAVRSPAPMSRTAQRDLGARGRQRACGLDTDTGGTAGDNGAPAGQVDSDDILVSVSVSVSGVALAAGEKSMREQAGRLLDLLLDGLRYTP